jgi:hypothetical protein
MKQKSHGASARYEQPQPPKGLSGYDPEDKDMRGVFMARGPGNKNCSGSVAENVLENGQNVNKIQKQFLSPSLRRNHPELSVALETM